MTKKFYASAHKFIRRKLELNRNKTNIKKQIRFILSLFLLGEKFYAKKNIP
ncbi:hypothetical protein LEP1GSC133_4866 [Leptospira borgpetersenii serovar Pomona str. 200901868]|uniref:Uncharacterized protein n=1 Tax=Leptospira borgpetersenii serovar Pomona str. 200901868 TaxID=1192866 RepID=M6VXM2_LEPBO|nr:hypothetical protein LEP1GSC133_4866 [Leptospira borgpetersenii serovar Pomona str. 200901868]